MPDMLEKSRLLMLALAVCLAAPALAAPPLPADPRAARAVQDYAPD